LKKPPKKYVIWDQDKNFQVLIQNNSVSSLNLRILAIYKDHPSFESIKYFSSLTELRLTHLYLEKVPEWIQYLSELRVLDLSMNHIRNLPQFLLALKKLEYLDVSSNRIDIYEGIIGGPPYLDPTKRVIHELIKKGVDVCYFLPP